MSDESGSHYIINKNLQSIIEVVLSDINDFSLSSSLKLKSLGVMLNVIKFAGTNINPYVEKIFQSLYKNIDRDEVEIRQLIDTIANLIGIYTQKSVLIPILIKHISDSELKTSYQALSNRLGIFSNVVSNIFNIDEEDASNIINCIENLDIFNLPEGVFVVEILLYTHRLYHGLVSNLKESCRKLQFKLFIPLLLLKSIPDTAKYHQEIFKSLELLAINAGHGSLDILISVELKQILDKFLISHKDWRKNSPDRFAFDAFVRNAGGSLQDNWVPVLKIINNCCEAVKDIEIRMDMIALVQFLLENKKIEEQIIGYNEYIISEILVPAIAWKPSRPNYKVRKGALVCMIILFDRGLIEDSLCYSLFKDFVSVLKSTLDDDWDAELRFLSVKWFYRIMNLVQNNLVEQDLLDIYQMILKRLDDSQNTIRIETTSILKIYFKIIERVWISETIYEFIVKTLFIHFDDQNQQVRQSIKETLKLSLTRYSKKFLDIANENYKRFTHKSDCEEILEFANEFTNKN